MENGFNIYNYRSYRDFTGLKAFVGYGYWLIITVSFGIKTINKKKLEKSSSFFVIINEEGEYYEKKSR